MRVKMSENYRIIAFYYLKPMVEIEQLRKYLHKQCESFDIKGTILIAEEGINGTIAALSENIDKFLTMISSDERFEGFEWKESWDTVCPFQKLKVKLREEVVRFGHECNYETKGEYVEPRDWDDFINRDDVVLIDTRNIYEWKIGTFKNAVLPETKTFREFPEWANEWSKDKDKKNLKVAMCCTGGIRCEKSTVFMKDMGFEKVYHLKGGILQYFEDTQNKNNEWVGNCFVFDERVAVNDALEKADNVKCSICEKTMTTDDLRFGDLHNSICLDCYQVSEAQA